MSVPYDPMYLPKASTIVTSLAREINNLLKGQFCSFATWQSNNLKKVKATDLDPNYKNLNCKLEILYDKYYPK